MAETISVKITVTNEYSETAVREIEMEMENYIDPSLVVNYLTDKSRLEGMYEDLGLSNIAVKGVIPR